MGIRDGGNNYLLKFGGGNHHKSHRDSVNQHSFSKAVVKITLLLVIIGVLRFVIDQSDYSTQLVQKSHSISSPKVLKQPRQNFASSLREFKSDDLATYANDEKKLENILKKAAMKDRKTVIITTLNAAWTEPNSIFDLFLESFRIGNQTQSLVKHLVVVAVDQKAYSRCLEIHPHCFLLTTAGIDFSGEAFFMSDVYFKMMWRRTQFLGSVIAMGYSFIFTDADIMWFRDPFARFDPDGDFQIACDYYNFNSTNRHNAPNGGFMYVKSNNRTIEFYKYWYKSKDRFPGKNEQEVLNLIKLTPPVFEIGVDMRFLNTAYFGGFCQLSKDLDLVVTMHANCCLGLKNKINDIKILIEDWKKYFYHQKNDKSLSSVGSWSVPQMCLRSRRKHKGKE